METASVGAVRPETPLVLADGWRFATDEPPTPREDYHIERVSVFVSDGGTTVKLYRWTLRKEIADELKHRAEQTRLQILASDNAAIVARERRTLRVRGRRR